MMEGFMSYFSGRRDPNKSAREAIIGLKQQLTVLEKKEEFLHLKIDAETKKAKANAVSNKAGAYPFIPPVPFYHIPSFVARHEPLDGHQPDHHWDAILIISLLQLPWPHCGGRNRANPNSNG